MVEKLGSLLVQRGVITPAQLEEGLEAQRSRGGRLGTNLIELQYLDLYTLPHFLAEQRGVPVLTAAEFDEVQGGALTLVPRAVAVEHLAVPLGVERGRLVVAMADAWNPAAVESLERALRAPVVARAAAELHVLRGLERWYGVRLREPPPPDPDGYLSRDAGDAPVLPAEPDTSAFVLSPERELTSEDDELHLRTGASPLRPEPVVAEVATDPELPALSRPEAVTDPVLPALARPVPDDLPTLSEDELEAVDAEPDPFLEPPPEVTPRAEPPGPAVSDGPDWVIEAEPAAPAAPQSSEPESAGPDWVIEAEPGPVEPKPAPAPAAPASDDWVIESPPDDPNQKV